MKPYFSVVISVYNKAHFVAQTLQSILDQDFQDFEIIIVDYGSKDNSLEILRNFSCTKFWIIKS